MMNTSFNISLVQALMAAGRLEEDITLIEATIQSVEANGDFCYLPELLRVKASLLYRLPQPLDGLAETCLTESLALSRRQGALAWELRSSIDLSRCFAAQGTPGLARAVLQPIFDRFTDRADRSDLRTAKDLLAGWG